MTRRRLKSYRVVRHERDRQRLRLSVVGEPERVRIQTQVDALQLELDAIDGYIDELPLAAVGKVSLRELFRLLFVDGEDAHKLEWYAKQAGVTRQHLNRIIAERIA